MLKAPHVLLIGAAGRNTGKTELAERTEAIKHIENTLRALRNEIEEKRVRAVDLASERARHNNELSAIAAQKEQLQQKMLLFTVDVQLYIKN